MAKTTDSRSHYPCKLKGDGLRQWLQASRGWQQQLTNTGYDTKALIGTILPKAHTKAKGLKYLPLSLKGWVDEF